MGLFDRARDALTRPSLDDTALYAEITREIESGMMRPGIWAKALAEAGFDEAKAKALYMRMAVAALKQELRERASEDARRQSLAIEQEAGRKKALMDGAIALYDRGQYAAAVEGLMLRVQTTGDLIAMACLANIAWHGLADGKANQPVALQYIAAVEQSTNEHARGYLGIILEKIDWQRSLKNYDWAAAMGNKDAAERARYLRKVLRSRGQLPETFFSKLFK